VKAKLILGYAGNAVELELGETFDNGIGVRYAFVTPESMELLRAAFKLFPVKGDVDIRVIEEIR